MKKTLKTTLFKILPLAVLALVGVSLLAPSETFASVNQIRQGVNDVNNGSETNLEDIIQNVINILLFLVGSVAVVMLIIGGFRYVTANGDSSSITAAKNTILYAVIGIVVALAAFAIVTFVLDAF